MSREKINILLIDDDPFCFSNFYVDVSLLEKGEEKYEDYFNLYWLQTPAEAAWLLDTYNELSIKTPQDILALGLPPEILIFDYELLSPKRPKLPTQNSNIAKKLCTHFKIPDSAIDEYSQTVPAVADTENKLGCYIGGVFAREFSNYPCAAIPTTARVKEYIEENEEEKEEYTDDIFFEWFNRKYFKNAFAFKTRHTPDWKTLINYGIYLFRERVIDLINASLIRIRLTELEILSRNPTEAKSQYLYIYSNLGVREIPIAGVFIDAKDEENYREIAKEWADRVLERLFKKGDFFKAKKVAELYFDSFYSDTRKLRERLSNLAYILADGSINELNQIEIDDLSSLCTRFKVNFNDVIKNPRTVKINCYTLPVWKGYEKINNSIARWVVLMLIVKAEQYAEDEAISVSDVLNLLNPLPDSLLIDAKNQAASQAVSRLKLRVESVLKQKSEKGLMQGEGYLLRLYADEIGFKDDRPLWLDNAL